MALKFLCKQIPEGLVPQVHLDRAPALRQAQEVEYRRGANLQVFVADLLTRTHVKITGATSAGKSTVLPKAIAKLGRVTVIHVTAHPLLAYTAAKAYEADSTVGFDASGLRTARMVSRDQVLMPGSLVWADGPSMVAWMYAHREDRAALDGVVVYLDEAHQSDAFSHVVRSLSVAFGARSLVMASATFTPAGFRPVESSGQVQERRYDVPMSEWHPMDGGYPWSASSIKETALYFLDSLSQVERLRDEYDRMGVITHHLTSRSTVSDYETAMADFNNDKGPIVVLFCDSSYRDGFNFDCTDIFDSGEVYYRDPEIGVSRIRARRMYNFEYVQSRNRGGRFAGRTVKYNCPEGEYERVMCSLEPVEAEAAALLYRCLGFSPTGALAAAVMAHDDLPSDMSVLSALSGEYPLSTHTRNPDGSIRPGVVPVLERPGSAASAAASRRSARSASPVARVSVTSAQIAHEPVPVELPERDDVIRHYEAMVAEKSPVARDRVPVPFDEAEAAALLDKAARMLDEGRSVGNSSSGGSFSDSSGGDPVDTCADETWESIRAAVSMRIDPPVPEGGIVYSPDLSRSMVPDVSSIFPRALKSIYKFGERHNLRTIVHGTPLEDRAYAFSQLLDRYNVLTLELAAVRQAVVDAARGRVHMLDVPSVGRRLARILEKCGAWEVERRTAYSLLLAFGGKKFAIHPCPGVPPAFNDRLESYFKEVDNMMSREAETSSGYMHRLDQRVLGVPCNLLPRHKPPLLERNGGFEKVDSWSGVSRVRIKDDGCDLRPSRFMRKMTGIDRVSVRDDRVMLRRGRKD